MPNLVKEYSVFEADKYKNLMPQLRNAGLRPLNTADIMREKLEALNTKNLQLVAFWLDRYFDTVDGIAYNNGERKIVLDAKPLLEIQSNSNLNEGALILQPKYDYGKLEGEKFSLRQLQKAGIDRRLSEDEAINHPVWLALARGDKHLLREYRDAIFAEIKIRYSDKQGMGVYLSSEQKHPSMRAWAVSALSNRSGAYDRHGLGGNARLVGVRSKITEGDAQKLVRAYAPEDIEIIRRTIETLKSTTKPEILKPLEEMVRR